MLFAVIRQSNGCLQQQTLLRLALEWNRPDLAKADILVEDHRISKRYLAKEMLPLALQMVKTTLVLTPHTLRQRPSLLKNVRGDKPYCLRLDDVTTFTQPY